MATIDRRRFLTSTATLAALAALGPPLFSRTGAPRKALSIPPLPGDKPFLDRFRMAADAGFAGLEISSTEDQARAERIREGAGLSGLRIHSVRNANQSRDPLWSADPEVVRRGVAGMETSLRNAKLWGAGVVVLVPAVADPRTTYRDAWIRSHRVIGDRILPLARELKIVVAVEGVWDRFLLGPLEQARYVDAFASPWVKACLDTGNVVFYAYPQDWIRTLGRRVATLRVRDFRLDRASGRLQPRNIGEGDVDWAEVRKALREVGYDGWVTADVASGDAGDLRDVAARLDRCLIGQRAPRT